MKKLLIALLISSLALTACGQSQAPTRTVTQSTSNEIEDCDLDDILEGDEDCYGVDLEKKKKKSKAKATSKPKSKVKWKSKSKSKK